MSPMTRRERVRCPNCRKPLQAINRILDYGQYICGDCHIEVVLLNGSMSIRGLDYEEV